MNYFQYGLWLLYIASAAGVGTAVHRWLNQEGESRLHPFVFLGEVFLLGCTVIYAEMMVWSLVGLYKGPLLWLAVVGNLIAWGAGAVRREWAAEVLKKFRWDLPTVIFIALFFWFIFRNSYFMVDPDSHKTYLYTQKLWLAGGTSLVGNPGTDITVFIPQFDAVPYGLGLSVFPQETLFPQLINLWWRLVTLLVLFGYVAYRRNSWCGLAASLMLLFNDHFFNSGMNACVIINGALIGLIFVSVYNFWESRRSNSRFRMVLALIFLILLMSNKYQMAYSFIFLLLVGISIQKNPREIYKWFRHSSRYWTALAAAGFISGLWYLKNYLITGLATFPIFAGDFGVFNWTPEASHAFMKVLGGVALPLFMKYMSYFFVWPGIIPAKYVIVMLSFLPFIFWSALRKPPVPVEELLELCFWLGTSLLLLMGICLSCHQDPRYYRFPMAVMAFAAVYGMHFLLRYCCGIKSEFVASSLILLLSLPGYPILMQAKSLCDSPSMEENLQVLLDRLHTRDAMLKFYPGVSAINKELEDNPQAREKLNFSAWGYGELIPAHASPFLLPLRPQISLWLTSAIRWDSYDDPKLIVRDLEKLGIKWVASPENGRLEFFTLEEYAQIAAKFVRHRSSTIYDYGFPAEISQVKW